MTQDSESVVVPRDQQRQLDAEQLMDAAGTLSRCGYGEDAEEMRAVALRLAAAPSTSVREEVAGALERAAKVADVEERSAIDAFREEATADMRAYRRGRAEAGQCIALAIRALVPSTDEGKRHG